MIRSSRQLHVMIVIGVGAAFLLYFVKLSLASDAKSGWLEWREWSSGCPRRCSEEIGYRKRMRYCRSCILDVCTQTAAIGQSCAGGGDPDEVQMCYEPTCWGAGPFKGSWTAWTKTSKCARDKSILPCQAYQVDEVGKITYTRKCNGSSRVPKQKCTDLYGQGTIKKVNCSLPCPARDGGWSEWGSWSRCSVTCGKGVYVAKRGCIDPAPMGAGKVCDGKAERFSECIRDVTCPIDGGWSGWSEWICSVTCGGGTGTRKRRCDNPPPAPHGGRGCEGSSREVRSCNNATCPKVGEITSSILSAKIKGKIWTTLQNADTNYKIKEGENLQIQCPTDIVEMVREDFPSAEIVWTKNTKALNLDPERIVSYKGQLMFSSIITEDSGVYVCEIEYEPPLTQAIGIYCVVVMSQKPTKGVSKKSMVEFACNAEPFTDLLSSITRTWFHNDTEVHTKVLTGESDEEVSEDRIDDRVKGEGDMLELTQVMPDDNGVWECRVIDNPTKRTWTTSWIRLKVLPEPSGWEKFSSSPAQVGSVIGAVIGVILIVCLIFMCRSKPNLDEAEKAVEKMKLLEGQVDKDEELRVGEESGSEEEDENEIMEGADMHRQGGYHQQ